MKSAPQSSWILRSIPDGLLALDLDGHVLFANERFQEMLARAGQELRGRHCSELFDAAVCARIDPRGLALRGARPQVHFNLELPGPDEQPRSYCFTASPLLDAQGALLGVLEDFRSMDALRQVILELEEVNRIVRAEKDKTERIMDSMADGVFTVDPERRLRSFSAKLEQLTGVRAADALGRPCQEVLRGSKCDSDCPLTWSLAHGQTVDQCREVLSPTGSAIPVSVTTALLHDEEGRPAGLTVAVQNRSELERLRSEVRVQRGLGRIVGRSRTMQTVFDVIESVAETDATVLVLGESGTGKEVVARAIHERSLRRARPFVALNCAALNDNLLESELFGHVRGAFTGAVADKLSRFELAAGGTLFLDEIGDTTPALQARLLRVLEDKTFERVGDTRTRSADVRVIAATHRDLRSLVEQSRFREDLYYRLAVVPVRLPALRERREDVPLLVQHFIEKYRPLYFKGREDAFEGISNRALALLMLYDWPGNVRELEHAIEYALICTTTGRIERAFLPLPLQSLVDGTATLAEAAKPATPADPVIAALERHRWNATRAARDLGVSRTTLWKRMKARDLGRRIG